MFTQVKTDSEIAAMRESARILADILDQLEQTVDVGMNMLEIDEFARKEAKAKGAETPFLGYGDPPFPGAICISVNDEVEHGTPRDIELVDGDIVSLDFGIKYKGMISDSGRTLPVGDVSAKNLKLLETTKRSLYAGIDVVKDGVKVGDISAAVEKVLKKGGYGIIRDLVGHGVGHELHEDPNIPNFGKAGRGPMLKAGMTICIEPMAALGDWRITVDEDNWTLRMLDGSNAAHFEHTLLITDNGVEVLTESKLLEYMVGIVFGVLLVVPSVFAFWVWQEKQLSKKVMKNLKKEMDVGSILFEGFVSLPSEKPSRAVVGIDEKTLVLARIKMDTNRQIKGDVPIIVTNLKDIKSATRKQSSFSLTSKSDTIMMAFKVNKAESNDLVKQPAKQFEDLLRQNKVVIL